MSFIFVSIFHVKRIFNLPRIPSCICMIIENLLLNCSSFIYEYLTLLFFRNTILFYQIISLKTFARLNDNNQFKVKPFIANFKKFSNLYLNLLNSYESRKRVRFRPQRSSDYEIKYILTLEMDLIFLFTSGEYLLKVKWWFSLANVFAIKYFSECFRAVTLIFSVKRYLIFF